MPEPTPNPDKALKDKILKGGLSLALRQMVTSVLSLVSILVVARILGPKQYGIVAVAMGIFYFLVWSNKLGIGVYFVREQSLPENCSQNILTFYNHISFVTAVALWFLAPAIAPGRSNPKPSGWFAF
ncbi:MAG: oligosaccharide flippase family protein [Synechococcales cyanobacterium RU_4_20]|nr:oligosaccharide flippase family protein [Synechococcales cyanobacterium RU_4_20]NJR70601.1 oligosaccharide flippase family protein [Synechococcales cyanobacterium CRU_2_2]